MASAAATAATAAAEVPEFYPYSGLQEERNTVHEILPRLYLTNFRGAEDLRGLQQLGVASVVCVNGDAADNPHEAALRYLNIEGVEDTEGEGGALEAHFERVRAFVAAALAEEAGAEKSGGGGVVVHCAAGISRSSAVLLYFLMAERGMRLREAFAHMRARRPVVWPNRGFMERLIACEAKLGHSPPSLSMAEYDAWCEFDIEEYQKASVIDR